MFSHFQGSSERASSTHISSCHLCHLTDKEHPNEQRWDGNIASDVGAAGRHHDLLREVACYSGVIAAEASNRVMAPSTRTMECLYFHRICALQRALSSRTHSHEL